MASSLLGLLLLSVALSAAVEPLKNFCIAPEKHGYAVDLDMKMKLSGDYNLEGTFTDWLHNKASYFAETSLTEQKAISISSSRYVQLDGQFYSVNSTDCLPQKDVHPYSIPQSTLNVLNLTQPSSVVELVNGFLSLKVKGSLIDTRIIAGIEGVGWMTCINGTSNTTAIQVEVVYTGDKSIPPASPSFKNPQLLFLHLKEYSLTDPNGTFTNSYSFSIDKRTETDKGSQSYKIPRGVFCEGRNSTPSPSTFADPVNLIVQNNTQDQKQVYELFYSQASGLAVVTTSVVKKGEIIPFFGIPADTDATTFVHDYTTGYEYSFGASRCVSIQAINKLSREVTTVDSKLSMRSLDALIINASSWQTYGKAEPGDQMTVYKAKAADGKVIELQKMGSEMVIRTYQKGVEESPVVTLLSYNGVPQVDSLVRECYAHHFDESFLFTVKDKKMDDVYDQGEAEITKALANTFQEKYKINGYRVKATYYASSNGGVDILFQIAAKNPKQPMNTTISFDYLVESDTKKFFEELNKDIKGKDWTFSVDGQSYTVAKSSLSQYPVPPPKPAPVPYQGYTGGAMFVLALFSLATGAAIGAGALFFVTRRQRISTLAYQVFE